MLLEEELNNVYELRSKDINICCVALLESCLKRIHDPRDIGLPAFFNEIKDIDVAWRTFCGTHHEFTPEGFRKIALRNLDEDDITSIKDWLGWE